MLDELTLFSYFHIETILSFCIKLGMVERWQHLQPETGRAMFDRLVQELEHSFRFSNEFITVGGES